MKKLAKIGLLVGLLLVSGSKVNNSSVLLNPKYNLEELITIPIITPINFNKIKQNDSFNIPKFEAVKSQESPKKEETLEDIKTKTLSDIEKNIIFIYENHEIPEYITKEFIRSQIWAESSDFPNAEGEAGERGLLQLTLNAWNSVEKNDDFYEKAFDPQKNIEVGIKYHLWINDYCKKKHPNWDKLSNIEKRKFISAAYNAGVGRLKRTNWDLNKIPEITKRYIKKIEGNLERFIF